jgi:hypothetical protein
VAVLPARRQLKRTRDEKESHGPHGLRFVTGAGEHDSPDRRATLFFPPAALPATLIFATVLAVVKSWGRIRGHRNPGVQRR